MHELSVAESIINSLEKLKEQENFCVIRSINIEIGHLSGIDIQALRFALDSIKKHTLLSEAVINLIPMSITIRCLDCDALTRIKDYEFICGSCGSESVEMETGDSILITELEVD
ncbi:MAG: hydrogenase maturation nickel metallochaperone HypA [Acidobacteria bacterium]|nr:hydrogenase maturation nickel metallochaperone HypA [Acidobacteriota bacterium]